MTLHEQHLRKGLLPALLAIVLLALVYVAVIVKSDFELKQSEIERSLGRYADSTLVSLDKLFAGYESVLGAVAESRCVRSASDDACRDFFPRLLLRFPEAVNFAATDRDGNIFASAQPFDSKKTRSAKDLPFFKALAGGRSRYIMDPHTGPVSGEQIVGIAIPLRGDAGRFAGVIGVTIRFAQLRTLWEEHSSDAAHGLVIVDRHDRPIFATGVLQKKLAQAAPLLLPALQKEGAGTIVVDGERLLTHSVFLRDGEWKIIAVTPADFGLKKYLSGNLLVFALALPILLLSLLWVLIYAHERRAIRLLASSEERLRTAYDQLEIKVVERTAELAAAKESNERILSAAPVGVITYDAGGQCLTANRMAATVLGAASGQLEQQNFRQIASWKKYGLLENAEQALQSGKVIRNEHYLQTTFGKTVWVDTIFASFASNGQPRLLMILSDISERKRKEEEYRTIIQASIDGFWIVDAEGCFIEVNDSYCRLVGYPREDLQHMRLADIRADQTAEEVAAHLRKVAEFGTEQFQTRLRCKDGRVIDVEANIQCSPSRNEYFFAFVRDITERNRTEEMLHDQQVHLESLVQQRTAELQIALEAAQLADRAKDQFLANISHELRTPLNAVIGMADLARRISSEPRQKDYLDKISNAGKTLANLINDLLDLSKIAAGRMEFENITFSPRGVIKRCNSVMSYRVAEKRLQLIERVDQRVPDALVGDPLRVEQILLNLLSNAVKFTASGRIEVRVGVQESDAARVCLFIEVEDTGVGMCDEDLAGLFQPFAQADPSMTRKYGGTGLGLAICKRLAALMGGDIGVSSQLGRGSLFRVTLWLGVGDAEELRLAELQASEQVPMHYDNVRVLVVEDQPLNREIAEALLTETGITPSMASNGQEALELLAASGPGAFDLILMDIQMPVMDGLTATRELRRREGFADLPIIAMTAHTMAHEKEISLAAGMNDHIGKPFDNASFYRTLAHWIPPAKHRENPAPPATLPASHLSILKGVDTGAGLARLAGNEARYRHWLSNFIDEGPASIDLIRQAIVSEQSEQAQQAVHAFKGRVGMLGMDGLCALVEALETALKQGEPADAALDRLSVGVAQLSGEIRAAFGSPQAGFAKPETDFSHNPGANPGTDFGTNSSTDPSTIPSK